MTVKCKLPRGQKRDPSPVRTLHHGSYIGAWPAEMEMGSQGLDRSALSSDKVDLQGFYAGTEFGVFGETEDSRLELLSLDAGRDAQVLQRLADLRSPQP